jgi:hypothetical protein
MCLVYKSLKISGSNLWDAIVLGILPCTALIPGLFFIPESPRWLVCIRKGSYAVLHHSEFLSTAFCESIAGKDEQDG